MSQHTFSIANESGAAFRADVNSALQALASCSRGATAPATMYAAQVWDDSTANVQKKRNTANSAWIVKSTLDETFVLSRGSNTILGLSDIGKAIIATAGFTQTLTAAATLGDGWYCDFFNTHATNNCTLDPNGAETINGAATLTVPPGCGGRIFCNGSAFQVVLAQSVDKSQGTFTPGIDSTGPAYTTQTGSYTRIGRVVFFSLRVVLSSKGTGTFTAVTGLPFSAGGSGDGYYVVNVHIGTLTTSVVALSGRIEAGNTINLYLKTAAAASYTALALGDLANTSDIRITGSYEV